MPTGGSAKSTAALLKGYQKGSIYPKSMSTFKRLIFAIVSENQDPALAMKSIERVESKFIDWNECRVSRWVEMARALDPLPNSDKIAMRVKDMLNRLFDRKGTLCLDFCIDMKVTEARKALSELDLALSKQHVNMILFAYHPTMTLPVSPEGLDIAKKYKLVPKSAEKGHLQKVFAKMEHQDAIELLHYFEIEAINEARKNAPPAKKKTTKKKTTKKV